MKYRDGQEPKWSLYSKETAICHNLVVIKQIYKEQDVTSNGTN